MAGKFRAICTAFPLTTLSAKNSKWLPLQFPAKSCLNIASYKKIENKRIICFLLVKKKSEKDVLPLCSISQNQFSFFKLFARDNVSDRNLFPPFFVCNTGQKILYYLKERLRRFRLIVTILSGIVLLRTSRNLPVLTTLLKFWSTQTISI